MCQFWFWVLMSMSRTRTRLSRLIQLTGKLFVFQVSVFQDTLNLITFHIHCFYAYARRFKLNFNILKILILNLALKLRAYAFKSLRTTFYKCQKNIRNVCLLFGMLCNSNKRNYLVNQTINRINWWNNFLELFSLKKPWRKIKVNSKLQKSLMIIIS